jgi:molecular chaperone GrpE
MSKKEKDTKSHEANDVVIEDKNNDKTTRDAGQQAEDANAADGLDEIKSQLQEEKDRFLRLFAEFENYKRRTSKERIELFKTASQDLMVALLPVLDDFDRAIKEIKKGGDDGLLQGVELISNKLRETLKSKGLEPINTEVGEAFDAEIHEAVTQIPAPSDELKGKIVDVLEKGYKLGEKIIRFPKVVTGQ